jgi:hypothetical protein
VLDTATAQTADAPSAEAHSSLTVEGRSLLVLQKTD